MSQFSGFVCPQATKRELPFSNPALINTNVAKGSSFLSWCRIRQAKPCFSLFVGSKSDWLCFLPIFLNTLPADSQGGRQPLFLPTNTTFHHSLFYFFLPIILNCFFQSISGENRTMDFNFGQTSEGASHSCFRNFFCVRKFLALNHCG